MASYFCCRDGSLRHAQKCYIYINTNPPRSRESRSVLGKPRTIEHDSPMIEHDLLSILHLGVGGSGLLVLQVRERGGRSGLRLG